MTFFLLLLLLLQAGICHYMQKKRIGLWGEKNQDCLHAKQKKKILRPKKVFSRYKKERIFGHFFPSLPEYA